MVAAVIAEKIKSDTREAAGAGGGERKRRLFLLRLLFLQFRTLAARGGQRRIEARGGRGGREGLDERDVTALVRADCIQQRQQRRALIVLGDEQRLARAIDLHRRLRHVQARAGSSVELILRHATQSLE